MQVNREWINISDLMAGLMMVFLFISIVFMVQTEHEKKAMAKIALQVERSQKELNKDLHAEFDKDLKGWGAEIVDKDNTVRFNEPDILFKKGSSTIKNKFKVILDNFFPRYIKILASSKYRKDIDEVRIEGHTSSTWIRTVPRAVAYLKNARLSQDRSFSVLGYVYMLTNVKQYREWLVKVIRANGLSFAKIIKNPITGKEDYSRSRRVEFRVKTKTEDRISQIIRQSKSDN
ncbi:MAG: OmpA family protein [bacterium]